MKKKLKNEQNNCECDSIIKNLKAKNKELQKENKRLRDELSYFEKMMANMEMENFYEANGKRYNKNGNNKVDNKRQHSCPKCGKGVLQKTVIETPFRAYVFYICSLCKHRERGQPDHKEK